MIARGERSQGEFYVAPVYTHLSKTGLTRIGVHNIGRDGQGMYGLGTPDDLASFMLNPVLGTALGQAGAAV
jgi:hypothetical protein